MYSVNFRLFFQTATLLSHQATSIFAVSFREENKPLVPEVLFFIPDTPRDLEHILVASP